MLKLMDLKIGSTTFRFLVLSARYAIPPSLYHESIPTTDKPLGEIENGVALLSQVEAKN
jgi:hypothetical protein